MPLGQATAEKFNLLSQFNKLPLEHAAVGVVAGQLKTSADITRFQLHTLNVGHDVGLGVIYMTHRTILVTRLPNFKLCPCPLAIKLSRF
jgi:hypothetical protein